MAVEKMHFVSIVGLVSELDDFVLSSIAPFDVQLVNAYETLDSLKGIQKFSEENKYEKLLERIRNLVKLCGQELHYCEEKAHKIASINEVEARIQGFETQVQGYLDRQAALREEKDYKEKLLQQIEPLDSFKINIDEMFHFKYMKFRYGKMPIEGFEKLKEYSDNLDVIVHETYRDKEFSYVMYFTPASQELNMDSLFSSLSFSRIRISDEVVGRPHEVMEALKRRLVEIEKEEKELTERTKEFTHSYVEELESYYHYLVKLNGVFGVRNYAVHTEKAFYLAGWIPHSQIMKFKAKVKITPELSYVIEDEQAVKQKPPTLLKNPKFFKPFETIVKMYGVPAYDEMDPTIFVGLTYMLLFGMMFGDVGQGLVIALAGFWLSTKKKMEVAKILVYFGSMSMLFGVFYGSLFGNEEILREYLPFIPMYNPMEIKMELLGFSVVMGVGLLVIAMLFNMYNLWKNKNIGSLLFSKNGLVGLVFYLAVMYIILATVTSRPVPMWLVIGLVLVPLGLLFFSERIAHSINKKHNQKTEHSHTPSGIEAFFELVEIILSTFSNTISFVRVGAFALNHVGFFLAFHQLSHMVGGAGSIAVMIFGNILIIVLEGLIVGIQGLRLEYYELFSRFFKGDGKEFKPFQIKQN